VGLCGVRQVSEHDTQAAFVRWLALQRIPGIDTSYAVPNGGVRHPATARKLKAEGVSPGVPDWVWPSPRGGFVGLAIEFKHGDGVPSKDQRQRIDALQRDGWCVVICWDWTAAARVVQGYAGMLRVGIE
jgi:hypothetical protein